MRTAVPGRDGATYLWLGERVAAGDLPALFDTVFHPMHGLLVGALLAVLPDLDPFRAGQIVAAGLGTAAVLPLWLLARALFGERAAFWCAFAYAGGAWFCRHPAECLSEGPFYLLVASWALLLVGPRRRPAAAGVLAALAYATRAEGMALVLVGAAWLWAVRARRGALRFLAAALPLAALYPLGLWLWGNGFSLSPKLGFEHDASIARSAAPWLHYLTELGRLPLATAEELGFLWLPLAIAGVVLHRPRHRSDAQLVLLLPFLLQCAIVPLLHAHHRFLSGFGILLLPFAGAATARLLAAAAARHRALPWLVVAALVASELRVAGARHAGRAIERDLGRFLASRLQRDQTVVSDMPRLVYFAGRRPPPPRRLPAGEILALARDPHCRFVVLVAGRTDVADADLAALGLEPAAPPEPLAGPSRERGIRLFTRPPR
jgi:hypothetical protein